MYPYLLAAHSLVRWLVVAILLFAVFRSYRGWITKRIFSKIDHSTRLWTVSIAHMQAFLGVSLYIISPVISYFLHNYKDAVHQRDIRFFGMEHSLMMLTSVVLISIGSSKSKRTASDTQKFKTMAIWFTVALLIILASIPWPFSPMTSRPFFRPF